MIGKLQKLLAASESPKDKARLSSENLAKLCVQTIRSQHDQSFATQPEHHKQVIAAFRKHITELHRHVTKKEQAKAKKKTAYLLGEASDDKGASDDDDDDDDDESDSLSMHVTEASGDSPDIEFQTTEIEQQAFNVQLESDRHIVDSGGSRDITTDASLVYGIQKLTTPVKFKFLKGSQSADRIAFHADRRSPPTAHQGGLSHGHFWYGQSQYLHLVHWTTQS